MNQNKRTYMRTIVGKVSPIERDEIQALFERRNGLEELSKYNRQNEMC